MKLYKDGQLVGEFSTTELKELAGVDIEKAAEVAAEAVEVKSFEVGDKVKVVGVSVTGRDEFIGKTAVIADILEDGNIEIDEGDGDGEYSESSLEHFEEEPEEVLSYENVKAGELFEITGCRTHREFTLGTTVRMVGTRYDDADSIYLKDELTGAGCYVGFDEIKRHTPEVLSEDNVKEGEYFVITDNTCAHKFAIGEVIKAKSHTGYARFKAEHMDESNWWYVKYTDVRRATDAEIAEATKPKEVKFEVGDVVKVGAFDFATITQDIDPDGDYPVKYIENGSFNFAEPSNIRHATEEEKSHLQTLIGREKDEYKVGDLVELVTDIAAYNHGYGHLKGYVFEVDELDESSVPIHLKDNGNKADNFVDTWSLAADLKLITPVEWRHDFVEEVK